MSARLAILKKAAIVFCGVAVVYLVFAWLALPAILQSLAERTLAERTGHRLTLDRPVFNPFESSLRLSNLRLADPDGKPLFAFRELILDISAASVVRRALVFDNIRLDDPVATVVLQTDGRLNWSPLLDALKGKDDKPDSTLPRLDIERFVLAGGTIDFADKRASFATVVQPLELELQEISTLPDDQGHYKLSARTAFGARVNWQGDASLNPLAISGSIGIDELSLASLAPYARDFLGAPLSGSLATSARYRVAYNAGKIDLALDKLAATLVALRLSAPELGGAQLAVERIEMGEGRYVLAENKLTLGTVSINNAQVEMPRTGATSNTPFIPLQLAKLELEDTQLDLDAHALSVSNIALKGGRLKASRDAQGSIDALATTRSMARPASAAKPATAPKSSDWRYRVKQVRLTGFSGEFRDESVIPAADLRFDDIALAIDDLSHDLKTPLPVRASLRVRDGGSIEVVGRVVPAAASVDAKLKVDALALKLAQSYLSSQTRLVLAGGSLNVDGRVLYNPDGPRFKGAVFIRDLRLNEADSGELFASWKSLGSRDLEVTGAKLEIPELSLDGLDTKLIISKDKSFNAASLLHKIPTPDATGPSPASALPVAQTPALESAFVVSIERLRVSNGEVDFADLSLALPFATRVQRLRGAVIGLSSRPGAMGQVELEGQIDEYGLARAVGQINLFSPTDFTDLKVLFRNVEMTRLTPYTATFAGRKIDSGKLTLDLEYKIKKRQLSGENSVVMDQLELGERVESATAKNLPLDLAIALLRDADGRIELGLPVSGSLDDPQFSYGGLVWKALANVIGKLATAPFRALGALLGGNEKSERIAFETGETQLTPPEREKLARLAGALNKRPGLSMTIQGVYADVDTVSLQDRQLRRAVAERAGQRLEGQERPGPLSTSIPKIQAALESLYGERIGSGELAALKEAFRKANPGQLEQGVAGRMISRLSGLMREEKTLGEEELSQLAGADFHAVLFERLRDKELITEAQLLALAKSRLDHALAAMKTLGAPTDRVVSASSERVPGEGREVPLKVTLGAAQKVSPAN